MSDRNDSFSDLDEARALSHGLRGDGSRAFNLPHEDDGYVRLGAISPVAQKNAAFRPGSRTTPPASLPPLERATEGAYGVANWDLLARWCLEAIRGRAAFVMDRRGLIITHGGELDREHADELAARFAMAIEQATRMRRSDEDAVQVAIRLGDEWLSGLQLQLGDDEALVSVAVIADAPIPDQVRDRLVAYARQVGRV
jgi:hypothetical protein